jgi:hypothetical protein
MELHLTIIKKNEIMKITDRLKSPSPKFFKVLRNIGLALAAVGGTILAAPIALPVVVTMVGGYLAVTGGVLTAVSQLTTSDEGLIPATGKPEETEGLRSLDKLGTGEAQPDLPEDDER